MFEFRHGSGCRSDADPSSTEVAAATTSEGWTGHPVPFWRTVSDPIGKGTIASKSLIIPFLHRACAVALCRIVALYEVKFDDITCEYPPPSLKLALYIGDDTEYYPEGTNVGPGLWSSAEVEVLVLSGNLPIMKPLFLRAAALFKNRHRQYRLSKDEESSNILELSMTSNRAKSKVKSGKATNVGSSDDWNSSKSAAVHGATNISTNGRLEEELPRDRILVETDLEQKVYSLGAMTPVRPRES